DVKWTKGHVKRIKKGNKNERTGSVFEILALGMFCQPGQSVKPAGNSAKGLDAIITAENRPICLSIKNFGPSDYQRSVEIKSRNLHDHVVSDAKKLSRSWSGITLMGRYYPSDEDWNVLHARIPTLLRESAAVP